MVRGSETALESSDDAGPRTGGLPGIASVRPRAHDPASGDPTVELRFENGAKVCYRASEEGLREEWFGPADDAPARSHAVSAPVAHDADGETDVPFEERPPTRVLADRALCTLSTYLSFDDRAQAEFVWGDENVSVLFAE